MYDPMGTIHYEADSSGHERYHLEGGWPACISYELLTASYRDSAIGDKLMLGDLPLLRVLDRNEAMG